MNSNIHVQGQYKACPFQPWVVVPQQQQGLLAPGQGPRVSVNPMPCIGDRCAAFHAAASICLAGTQGGFAVDRMPGGQG